MFEKKKKPTTMTSAVRKKYNRLSWLKLDVASSAVRQTRSSEEVPICFGFYRIPRARVAVVALSGALQDSSDEEAAELTNTVVFLKYVRLGAVNTTLCTCGFSWLPDVTDLKVGTLGTSLSTAVGYCRNGGSTRRYQRELTVSSCKHHQRSLRLKMVASPTMDSVEAHAAHTYVVGRLTTNRNYRFLRGENPILAEA